MSAAVKRFWMPVAAAVALAYLVIMLVTGALPERRQLVQSEAAWRAPAGAGEHHARHRRRGRRAPPVFVRQADGWLREGSGGGGRGGARRDHRARGQVHAHRQSGARARARGDRRSRPRRVRARPPAPPDHARGRRRRGAGGRFRQRGRRRPAPVHAPEGSRRPLPDVGLRRQGVAGRPRRRAPRRGGRRRDRWCRSPIGEVAAIEIYAARQVLSLRARCHVGRGSCTGTRRATIRTRSIAPIRPQSERIAEALAAFGRTRIERSVAHGAGGRRLRPASIRRRSSSCSPTTRRGRRSSFAVGDVADGLGRYLQMPDHVEIVAVPDDQITGLIDLAAELEP